MSKKIEKYLSLHPAYNDDNMTSDVIALPDRR